MRQQHYRFLSVDKALLLASLLGLLLVTGCSHQRGIALRYTPLIQTERLADRNNPPAVAVGKFTDARTDTILMKHRLNPVSAHTFEFQSSDDVSAIVRIAFLDGLLKAGFDVPLSTTQDISTSFRVGGKVLTYSATTSSSWNVVNMDADVSVEISLLAGDKSPILFTVNGKSSIQSKDSVLTGSALPDLLDRALQECVKNFLADEKFRSFLKDLKH